MQILPCWNKTWGKHFRKLEQAKNFLDKTPKVQATKGNTDKWDFKKLKISYKAKEIINRVKRQPAGQEKIYSYSSFDKGLISQIYKELKTATTKIIQLNEQMSTYRHFSKEDVQAGCSGARL